VKLSGGGTPVQLDVDSEGMAIGLGASAALLFLGYAAHVV
jgi:hypothetical protein